MTPTIGTEVQTADNTVAHVSRVIKGIRCMNEHPCRHCGHLAFDDVWQVVCDDYNGRTILIHDIGGIFWETYNRPEFLGHKLCVQYLPIHEFKAPAYRKKTIWAKTYGLHWGLHDTPKEAIWEV